MAYFKHDYSARNDDKILEVRAKFGPEGYGLWWMILETIAENKGLNTSLIGGLSLGYGVAKGTLSELIDFCLEIELLYKDGDGMVQNRRMDEHLEEMKGYKDSGKKGAEIRWKNRGANKGANTPPIGEGNADKNREEKRREENTTHTNPAPASSWEANGYDKPASLEQVIEVANMSGFEAAVAERYWNKRESTDWMKASGNQQVPIRNWRADFALIASYLASDIAKEKDRASPSRSVTSTKAEPEPFYSGPDMDKITKQVARLTGTR